MFGIERMFGRPKELKEPKEEERFLSDILANGEGEKFRLGV